MYKINFRQLTSRGDKVVNQDYMLNKIGEDYALFIVADGLGGHQAGEMASRYFCQCFVKLSAKYGGSINKAPEKIVLRWFNAAVFMMSKAFYGNPDAHDAFTTCAILIVTDKHVISAHCGDTRIYRINKDGIIWRTKDHSIPQLLFDEGELAENKMGTHPEQNQLTRSISIANTYPPDIAIYPKPSVNDNFIICSDGFWEFTKEHELETFANIELEKEYLLKQARMALFRANGRADNLTVQWVRV